MKARNKVFLVSLGCAKNLVDSEHLIGLLQARGHSVVESLEQAEVGVINTCGFLQAAVEEAVENVLALAEHKQRGRLRKIFVAGCFVQRYGYKLRKEIPEVDGWLGTGEIHRIAELIEEADGGGFIPFYMGRPMFLADHTTPRVQSTPFFTAYMKIAEGCSHRCTYCIIPRLRGPFRSRELESLHIEAEKMVDRGVKEINLIAQDTTMYGQDLPERVCLEDLLERLVLIKGLKWIRLLYCHPETISDRLLDLLDSEEALCPYLDIPLQHVNQSLLKTMGRVGSESAWSLLDRIRGSSRKRRISVRTSLMVGFPGETRAIFEELAEFVKAAELDRLGVFVFSPEEGAPAARFVQKTGVKEARRRRDEIMTLQAEISRNLNEKMVGKVIPVLIEGESRETELLLSGRTSTMAPDADGQVLISKGRGIAGEIMPVRIREAHAYDLVGEIDG